VQAYAASINVLPSNTSVAPGESFYFDIVAEGVPVEGLSAFKLKVELSSAGADVVSVADTSQALPGNISVSSPLLTGPATSTRSGLGDFFLSGTGANGILSVNNQDFASGSAIFTFGHTDGYIPVTGTGTIVRLHLKAGSLTSADSISISLPEAMLFVNGIEHPVSTVTGAVVELSCMSVVPDLAGLYQAEAQSLIQNSNLTAGSVYEIDNWDGAYQLGRVLTQAPAPGTRTPCGGTVDFAVNNPPVDIIQGQVLDKPGDDTGKVLITWQPSASTDIAGYRFFSGETLLQEVKNPGAVGAEVGGLQVNQTSQVKIATFDVFGNQSSGAFLSASPLDDVPPVLSFSGVAEGAFYNIDITPVINVTETNLVSQTNMLDGVSYNNEPVNAEGSHVLSSSASDIAGNTASRTVNFTIDKTSPDITIMGVVNGGFYNSDLSPAISVNDINLDVSAFTLNGHPYLNSIISSEGAYELRADAVDKAGNNASYLYNFIVDRTVPQSWVLPGSPSFTNNGVSYISGLTSIALSGTDTGAAPSGIEALEYRFNGGAWSAYSTPFNISGQPDGIYHVDHRARDRAGNIGLVNTVDLTLDNTAPLSELSVGAPAFNGSDGTQYAGTASTISFTAVDASAGVKAVEYMIGTGPWSAYAAPFALTSEGENLVRYRSSDNVDNVEAEKSKTVFLDVTPPVSNLALSGPEYSSGALRYVNSSSQIGFNAADNLSGVALSEYKVDAGTYGPAGTFTLNDEGSHQITFRSKDNVENQETEKNQALIVDNTPPETQISLGEPRFTSQDGLVHVDVSGQYLLTATDAGSGVGTIEYRANAGSWTANSQFGLPEGIHDIEYRSADKLGNIEQSHTLLVSVESAIDISKSIPEYSRLLVWLNSCVVQDGGTGSCLDQQVIENVLNGGEGSYYIVKTKAEFQTELLNNFYTDYLVLGASETLDESKSRELRERVYNGAGLIVSLLGTASINEAFGISSIAALSGSNLGVAFLQSDVYEAATYLTAGSYVNASISDGETLAWLGPNNEYQGVVRKNYGRGKAIFFAFDLGYTLSGNTSQFAGILEAALAYIHRPSDGQYFPYDLVPVTMSLTNNWSQFELKWQDYYPAIVKLIDASTGQWITDNPKVTTTLLQAGETKYARMFALVPDSQGVHTLSTSVQYMDGTWKQYADKNLDLTVTRSTNSVLNDIIALLDGLSLTGAEATGRDAARQSIVSVRDRTVSGTAEMELNISDLLNAAENLKGITSLDVSTIRFSVDNLLRYWEERRYLGI
jgi:hypothetical protein